MSTEALIEYLFANGAAANTDGSFAAGVRNCTPMAVSTTMPGWGALRSALSFQGPGSVVEVPASEALTGLAQCAVEAVLKPAAGGPARMNLVEGQCLPVSLFLKKSGTAYTLAGSVHVRGGWKSIEAENHLITAGQWTHVAMVYTGDDIVLFVKNAVAARLILRGEELVPAGAKGLFMGTWVDGKRDQYKGLIAGVRVWDCIPPSRMAAIEQAEADGIGEIATKYLALGGPSGFLGAPTSIEKRMLKRKVVGGRSEYGRMRTYQNGHIYWSAVTGAHEVHGAILTLYGSKKGVLGYPKTDELAGAKSGTRVSRFEHGSIYWSAATGARYMTDHILVKYLLLGAESSFLGLPTTSEATVAGGKFVLFQHGAIYWSAATGAHEVHGAIRDRHVALGGAGGMLGFPITDESDVLKPNGQPSGGKFSRFQHGTVYWSAASGAHEVHGSIREHYENSGGPMGELGYPLTNETNHPGSDVRYNDFQKGIIVWKPGIGCMLVTKLRLHIGKVKTGTIDDGPGDKQAELITYTTVKVNGTVQPNHNNKRRPSGHAGSSHDINSNVDVNVVNHATSIYMKITAHDWDEWSDNDLLGNIEKTFDIRNFWGMLQGSPKGVYVDALPTKKGSSLTTLSHLKFDFSMSAPRAYDPTKAFREQRWWRSDNFGTPNLSYQQCADTFTDVGANQSWILHPLNNTFYHIAYKGIAEGGNCFGMSLEAVYARMGRSLFAEPVYDKVMNSTDDVNNTAANILPEVRKVMNDKQAYQLGADCIAWTVGKLASLSAIRPLDVYARVKHFLQTGNYPVLSMIQLNDFKGHTVMPFRCEDGAGNNPHKIFIADPNVVWRQAVGDEVTYIEVRKDNTFRTVGQLTVFQSGTLPGTCLPNTLMFETPLHVLGHAPRTPIWDIVLALSCLVGGILILAGDAESEQVSSGQNKLYAVANGQRTGVVPNGIPMFARLPMLDAGNGAPEVFAQRGQLPENLTMAVKGTRSGEFSKHIATPTNSISITVPTTTGAREEISLNGLRTGRPMVEVKTLHQAKVAKVEYGIHLERGTGGVRTFSLDLGLAKNEVARVGHTTRGTGLVILPAGAARPIKVTASTLVDGKKDTGTVTLTGKQGDIITIRPRDWAQPKGEMVMETLHSINGKVKTRTFIKPQ